MTTNNITQEQSELKTIPEKLRSETRTKEMADEILNAAISHFAAYDIYEEELYVVWEHNQWWVQFSDDIEERTRTFSVTDCISENGKEYFDFEEV